MRLSCFGGGAFSACLASQQSCYLLVKPKRLQLSQLLSLQDQISQLNICLLAWEQSRVPASEVTPSLHCKSSTGFILRGMIRLESGIAFSQIKFTAAPAYLHLFWSQALEEPMGCKRDNLPFHTKTQNKALIKQSNTAKPSKTDPLGLHVRMTTLVLTPSLGSAFRATRPLWL